MTTERIYLFNDLCKSKPVDHLIQRQFVKNGYLHIVLDDDIELADEWEVIECARQAGISFTAYRLGELLLTERADA